MYVDWLENISPDGDEYGNNPFRETLTTDPLPKEPYTIT